MDVYITLQKCQIHKTQTVHQLKLMQSYSKVLETVDL